MKYLWLDQVKQFNYLGCELSLDDEPDFDKKVNRFQRICGTIRKYLKEIRIDSQIKFYKVLARAALLYGSETWVITKRNMTRLEAARNDLFKKCQRLHKIRQNKKRIHKKRTGDLWNTRCEIQIQTKLDQPSSKNGQHQTAETRPTI